MSLNRDCTVCTQWRDNWKWIWDEFNFWQQTREAPRQLYNRSVPTLRFGLYSKSLLVCTLDYQISKHACLFFSIEISFLCRLVYYCALIKYWYSQNFELLKKKKQRKKTKSWKNFATFLYSVFCEHFCHVNLFCSVCLLDIKSTQEQVTENYWLSINGSQLL